MAYAAVSKALRVDNMMIPWPLVLHGKIDVGSQGYEAYESSHPHLFL